MSKTIQRYQQEFGLAITRELQRNQERSRRGKTPLQPSLGNQAAATSAQAAADASAKSNAAQTNAVNTAYSNSQNQANAAQNNASSYAQQLDNQDNRHVPSGGQIMWDMGGGIPSGYSDTGYTITFSNVTRRVIRKQ